MKQAGSRVELVFSHKYYSFKCLPTHVELLFDFISVDFEVILDSSVHSRTLFSCSKLISRFFSRLNYYLDSVLPFEGAIFVLLF